VMSLPDYPGLLAFACWLDRFCRPAFGPPAPWRFAYADGSEPCLPLPATAGTPESAGPPGPFAFPATWAPSASLWRVASRRQRGRPFVLSRGKP
jgi:hypothetical protein